MDTQQDSKILRCQDLSHPLHFANNIQKQKQGLRGKGGRENQYIHLKDYDGDDQNHSPPGVLAGIRPPRLRDE